MKKLSKQTATLLFFLLTGVLVVIAFISYNKIGQFNKSVNWVIHTHVVKDNLAELGSNIINAETGQRGYLITNDTVFLQPFYGSEQRSNHVFATLDSLISDNAQQQENLKKLKTLFGERYSLLNKKLKLFKNNQSTNLPADSLVLKGKNKMDEVRKQISLMLHTENSLLEQRLQLKNRFASITPIFLLLLSIFSIAALTFFFFRLRKETSLRVSTEKVREIETEARRNIEEANDELNFAIEATELGTWDFSPLTNKFITNKRLKDWSGLPHEKEVDFSTGLNMIAENDRSHVSQDFQKALDYESGGSYNIEYTIINSVTKQERIVCAKGRAWFGDDKKAYRFSGTLQDITQLVNARKQLEASEAKFRNLIMEAPALFCVFKGEELVFEMANRLYKEVVGNRDIIGKPIREALPELAGQGQYEMLDRVYKTGETINGNEVPVNLMKSDGSMKKAYFNFTYQAYRNTNNDIEGILVLANEVTEQVNARKQIEKSEEDLKRYKHMADNATEPFILMREDGTFAYLNDLALERWGYTKKEAQYIRVADVDPIYNDEVFNAAFAASQKEKLPQFETLHKRKDGTTFPVEINMGGFTLEGKPHMFAIARDITERKKLENAVRESEEKIRSFILQAPVAMCLYRGPQYIIEIVNDELLTIWDKPLDSVINKPVFDVLPEARGQGFEALLDKVYTTGEKFTGFGIPIILARNGKPETIYVNLVYQAYREADGAISGIVEVVSNVTEQVTATQQIEKSENQFRTFANSIQNLAWIANGEGWIYWYNQQWYDYTGTTLEEMEGWGWEKVHHPEHIKTIIELATELWKKDEAWELTFPLRRHDGEYRWFLTRAFPVKDAAGNIERWVGTNTDITEQKTFTEELEKKVAERTEELQRSNEDLQQFAHVASHDLKEPVRKIKTFSSRFENEFGATLTEKGKLYLDKVQSSADRMYAMIEGVLIYSTINALEQGFETIDLNSTFQNIENDLEIIMQQKGALLQFKNLPQIEGIPVLIHQLFYNLVNNSLKFTKPGLPPLILVQGRVEMIEGIESAIIKVADNGIGFKQEQAEKIFQTFTRLHSKDQYEGTGLGLSLCRKIAERHHGSIRAEGIDGDGAKFVITLPMKQRQ